MKGREGERDISNAKFYAQRGPQCPTCGCFHDMPSSCADPFHAANPGERDERLEFEKWARPQFEADWCFELDSKGDYNNATVDWGWRTWLARSERVKGEK